MKSNYLFILAALVLVACNGGNTQKSEETSNQEKAEQNFKALPFPDVQIPSMISDSDEALRFLAENYWNGLTDISREFPCDSTLVSGVDSGVVEQKFADWTAVLNNVSLDVALKAIGKLYDNVLACERINQSSNVFETFVMLADKYFYDPNSPLRNEEFYLSFVSRYAAYDGLSDIERNKYERQVQLCGLNRIGTKAADFRFTDRRGVTRNMYSINADYTLLFFSNPGCGDCLDKINKLKDDTLISSMVDSRRMAVLNIYIDEDIQAWRSYMTIYPQQWYNGFDPDLILKSDEIYNIRAIPSIYLLDKEKNVLLKDVPLDALFSYLYSLCGTGMESCQ